MLPGGMADLFKYTLKLFFRSPDKNDRRSGVPLKLPGESSPRIVFGKLKIIIQDERAHKSSAAVKGATGHKTCASAAMSLVIGQHLRMTRQGCSLWARKQMYQ
eukprot:7943349-Pyramimonas_sp.AAC.1